MNFYKVFEIRENTNTINCLFVSYVNTELGNKNPSKKQLKIVKNEGVESCIVRNLKLHYSVFDEKKVPIKMYDKINIFTGKTLPCNSIYFSVVRRRDKLIYPFYKHLKCIEPVLFHNVPKPFGRFSLIDYRTCNTLCKMCNVNPINTYFLPCKHACMCFTCSLYFTQCLCNSKSIYIERFLRPRQINSNNFLVCQPCGKINGNCCSRIVNVDIY